MFKTRQGGEIKYGLMSFDAEPTDLLLDGPFTDKGLASVAGLEGLFGLSFFWHASALTAGGLKPLAGLPNLGFLGCGGELCNDEAIWGHRYSTALSVSPVVILSAHTIEIRPRSFNS